MEEEKSDIEIAEELEGMLDGALNLADEQFLESVLKLLKAKKRLKVQDSAKLRKIWDKHLGEKDGSDDEKNPDEEDIDEDDFV
jgi:hypothetical protein